MNIPPAVPRLNMPDVNTEGLEALRFWLQCTRTYDYQPIYRTDGRLLAVELLTAVTHPDAPGQRLAPDRYFSALPVRHHMMIIEEQLRLLATFGPFFMRHQIMASVNADGKTLLAIPHHSGIMALIRQLPWVRFERVESSPLARDTALESVNKLLPLWLDDFGTGIANFLAIKDVRYDYIKIARELFVMLRETQEGRNLFTPLIQAMNQYCQGVIVEGVETIKDWCDVQLSPACGVQGYFLSRPVPLSYIENVLVRLS